MEDRSEKLFKFVVVSPVEKATTAAINCTFVRYRGDRRPVFEERVLDIDAAGRTRAALETLADQHRETSEFSTRLDLGGGSADVATDIGHIVRDINLDGPAAKGLIGKVLGTKIDDAVKATSFREEKGRVWGNLYAAFLSADAHRNAEIDELVRAVQVVHVLEQVVEDATFLDDIVGRTSAIDATPLLPDHLAGTPAVPIDNTFTPPPGITSTLTEVECEIRALTAAIAELEVVESQRLDLIEAPPGGSTLEIDETEGSNVAVAGDTGREPWRMPTLPPWKLAAGDLESLSATTCDQLATVPTEEGAIVIPVAVEVLERERSRKLLQLDRIRNRRPER